MRSYILGEEEQLDETARYGSPSKEVLACRVYLQNTLCTSVRRAADHSSVSSTSRYFNRPPSSPALIQTNIENLFSLETRRAHGSGNIFARGNRVRASCNQRNTYFSVAVSLEPLATMIEPSSEKNQISFSNVFPSNLTFTLRKLHFLRYCCTV